MNTITYPYLNLEFNINPVAISFGKVSIYWYGIIIMSGILLAMVLGYFRQKRLTESYKKETNINWDNICDLVLFMLPIGIIFARIYYCIFRFDYYIEHPSEIFQIWNGGIAIYGGIIGGIITGIVFCKVKKIKFWEFADFCIPYVAMCQAIGRWGNFVNAEAYGEETNSFFKMGLVNNGQTTYYHPTFLYESVCNFLIFLILLLVSKHKKFSGQIVYLYFILYGFARFFIEGLRTDSLYLANTGIRISQLLSAVLFLTFLVLYIVKRIKAEKE